MTDTDASRGVHILRRLRELLQNQRDRLKSYLDILDLQHASIADGDVDRLQAQVETERVLLSEIREITRVIRPLEDLYRAAYPQREETVPALQAALEKLGREVKEANARNRAALQHKMDELRNEISSLRAWPRAASPFAEVTPSLVDITT
jgi:hypothetical protein